MKRVSVLVKPIVVVGCLGLVGACGGPANTQQTNGSSGPGRLSLTSGGLTPTCVPGQTQAQVISAFGSGRSTPMGPGGRAQEVGGSRSCTLADYRVPAGGVRLEYDGSRAPQTVGRQGWEAARRARDVWAAATAPRNLLELASAKNELPAVPTRDGHSAMAWGPLEGGPPDEVTRLVVWFSDGKLLEADCLLNTLVPWRVNPPSAGRDAVPDAYDVQAAVTMLLGHVVGLGPTASDGGGPSATASFDPLALGDCGRQSLTPGELRGARDVTPAQG